MERDCCSHSRAFFPPPSPEGSPWLICLECKGSISCQQLTDALADARGVRNYNVRFTLRSFLPLEIDSRSVALALFTELPLTHHRHSRTCSIYGAFTVLAHTDRLYSPLAPLTSCVPSAFAFPFPLAPLAIPAVVTYTYLASHQSYFQDDVAFERKQAHSACQKLRYVEI